MLSKRANRTWGEDSANFKVEFISEKLVSLISIGSCAIGIAPWTRATVVIPDVEIIEKHGAEFKLEIKI